MLAQLLVTATLRGLRPGPVLVRDPVPIVWYDRVRDLRALRNLLELTAALARNGRAPSPPAIHRTALDRDTETTAAPGGWASAVVLRVT